MISLIEPDKEYLIEFERLVLLAQDSVNPNHYRWCRQMFELVYGKYKVKTVYCLGISRIILDNGLIIDCEEQYWRIIGRTKQYKYLKRNLKYLAKYLEN